MSAFLYIFFFSILYLLFSLFSFFLSFPPICFIPHGVVFYFLFFCFFFFLPSRYDLDFFYNSSILLFLRDYE